MASLDFDSSDASIKYVLKTVVAQQQKRIKDLEDQLCRANNEIALLKKNPTGKVSAIATAIALPGLAVTASATAPTLKQVVEARFKPVTTPITKPKKKKSKKIRPEPEPGTTRYWTKTEHDKFLEGCKHFGPKNYAAISSFVKSRTAKQVRTHAQKFEKKLHREAMRSRRESSGNLSSTNSKESSGVRSRSSNVLSQVTGETLTKSPARNRIVQTSVSPDCVQKLDLDNGYDPKIKNPMSSVEMAAVVAVINEKALLSKREHDFESCYDRIKKEPGIGDDDPSFFPTETDSYMDVPEFFNDDASNSYCFNVPYE